MYQHYSSQETVSTDTNLRDIDPEKELFIEYMLKNNNLEARIIQMENESKTLRKELANQEYKNNQTLKVLADYEGFIKRSVDELEKVNNYKNLLRNHLATLEVSFHDLLEKYERAKTIVFGYKDNENVLKDYVLYLENSVGKTNKSYEDLKHKFDKYVQQANIVMKQKEENYLQELSKLNAQLNHSRLNVTGLENCNGSQYVNDWNEKLIFESLGSDVD